MYTKQKESWLKHWDFMLLDMLCLEMALFLAYHIRHGQGRWAISEYEMTGIVMLLIDICVVFFRNSYQDVIKRGYLKELYASFLHVTTVIIGVVMYLFFTKQSEIFSRLVWFWTWSIAFFSIYLIRITLKTWLRKRMTVRRKLRRLLLISTMDPALETLDNLRRGRYQDFEVVGIVITDQRMAGKKLMDIPVVADRDGILEYIRDHVVDEIFINVVDNFEIYNELVDACMQMGIAVHSNLLGLNGNAGNRVVEEIGGYTVLTNSISMASYQELFLKRLMDIAGGLVGMLLTGILFLFVAPAIKIKSPGPVIFVQTRVGKNGRRFKMYKFRSMYPDADKDKKMLNEQNEMQGLMFKMKDDPRIIPGVGVFIRKTSIDEFPQFFNVLKGDMSLVGTRPPTEDEYEQYDMHHLVRMSIKPGLTGLWQVSGRNEITDFEEVVRLDTEYITNWSLNTDIKILMKTISSVIEKRGF